jgi:hypothetical protein
MGQRAHAGLHLGPGGNVIAVDQGRGVGQTAGVLGQEMSQVHHPVGNGGYRTRSRIET